MSVSITDYYSNYYVNAATGGVSGASDTQAKALEGKLGNLSPETASDEELMDACKEFEAYLVEQVVKQIKESMIDSEDDKNDYMKVFEDTMVEDISETISETSNLGIAQSLYESMKRNMPTVNITQQEEETETAAGENAVPSV